MTNESYWQDKNVLITGGTGFIGSFLTKKLIENHAKVVCLTDNLAKESDFVRWGLDKKTEVILGNVLDLELLKSLTKKYGLTHVFHLAAQSKIPVSIQDPFGTLKINIDGTINVLEACRLKGDLEAIVIASSIGAYDANEKLPFTEESKLKGLSPYDASKSCVDILAQSYAKTYNLPITITRFSNLYGGGDLNFDRLIPRTIKNLIEGKKVVVRYGGKPRRGFFYIDDAINAFLLLGQKTAELKLSGEAFNFGPNSPTSVKDLVEKIIKISKIKKYELEMNDEGLHEVKDQYSSNEKARKILGWTNQYTLERGLEKTFEYYRQYLKTERV